MFDGTLKFDTKIDESGYELGLDKLGSIAKKGLSAVTGMASAVVSALGSVANSAVSGLVSFGQQAVQTGMDFQSAVSQIGATLGYTIDELNNPATEAYQNMELLTEKAEEMGAKTSFSATQAADGLNILAMSGYTAEESMQMIDSVLDMAAAGGLELASAASYVAGSMKGFTKEAGNFADKAEASKYYSDMIAKGATLANTNVQESADRLKTSFNNLKNSIQNLETAFQPLIDKLKEYFTSGEAGETAGTVLETAISGISAAVSVAADAISRLLAGVMDFVAWSTGETDGAQAFQTAVLGIVTAIGSFAGVLGIMTAVQHFATFLQFGLPVMLANLPNLLAGVSGAFSGLFGVIAANPVAALIAVLAGLVAMLVHVAQTSEEWQIGAQMIVDWMNEVRENWKIGIDEIGEWLGNLIQWFKDVGEGLGFLAGEMDEKIDKFEEYWEGFREYMFDLVEKAEQWGSDMIQNFIDGVNQMWNDAWQVVSDFAQMISDFLGFSEPEKGALSDFHTFAPDMMQLFAQGIRQKQKLVLTEAEAIAESLSGIFQNPVEIGTAVLSDNLQLPDFKPETQKFKTDTSENYEITFETAEFPEIPEFQNSAVIFDVPETPDFPDTKVSSVILESWEIPELENPEITLNSPELPEFPEFETAEIAFQLPEIPELNLISPDVPELESPAISLKIPDIQEIYLSSPEVPEIQNPEIDFSVPEIAFDVPELETSEIAFELPEIPELSLISPDMPEFENPEISLEIPDIPEIYFSSPEIPELESPEITLISPEMPAVPDLKAPELPEISPAEIGLKLVKLPSEAFTSPELPEIKNPEIMLNSPEIPETIQILIDERVLQALQNAELSVMQNSAKTSPVTEMINNHYHTINQNTVQNPPAEKKPSELTLYANIEMDEQVFGSAVKKVILDENSMSGGWFI